MSEWLERIVSNHLSSVEQESLLARAEQAEAAIARVRELHVEGPYQTCMVCATWKTWADGRTDLLGEPWPCSTIRALGGDGDEEWGMGVMEIERRPHWDDDLIEAVREAVFQCVDRDSGGVFDDALPDVIAAVEDWQNKFTTGRYAITLGRIGGRYLPEWIAQSAIHRAEQAEAQVQRVQKVCDLWQRRHDSSIRHPTAIPAIAITAVLRALDPVTETDCHGGDS